MFAAIGLNPTLFREDHLPKLPVTRGESAGERKKIELPHALELTRVAGSKSWPRLLELFIPRKKRTVIVRSEIMPIFHNEQTFDGLSNLRD